MTIVLISFFIFVLIMPSAKKYELSFFTATIMEWKYLLANDAYKDIIVGSLQHLVAQKRIHLYAFVIMNNHLHLLWHIIYPDTLEDVKRDFLKFTAQMIIKDLRNKDPGLLKEYYVGAKDRKYQVWERNPLNIEIWSEEVMRQKVNYIHNNPVKANLCIKADDYKYSSAAFYSGRINGTNMLTSCFM